MFIEIYVCRKTIIFPYLKRIFLKIVFIIELETKKKFRYLNKAVNK